MTRENGKLRRILFSITGIAVYGVVLLYSINAAALHRASSPELVAASDYATTAVSVSPGDLPDLW